MLDRYNELVDILNKANYEYHVLDNPTITDQEFDKYLRELIDLEIEYPEYPFYCTLQKAKATIPKTLISSHSLPYLCQFFGIEFNNHHNALADAEACAKIAMTLL